jgi:putative acetyltransferase
MISPAITRCHPQDAAALIAQAEAELALRYPPEHRHGLAVDALVAQDARFFLVTHEDEPAGCGGYVIFEPGHAELKRMFVARSHRGHGLSRDILREIEAAARAEGIRILYLETGTLQAEAIALYLSAGFRPCPPFGAYQPSPVSVFMEKNL